MLYEHYVFLNQSNITKVPNVISLHLYSYTLSPAYDEFDYYEHPAITSIFLLEKNTSNSHQC